MAQQLDIQASNADASSSENKNYRYLMHAPPAREVLLVEGELDEDPQLMNMLIKH